MAIDGNFSCCKMKDDFHNKPFDEGTLAKLEMFQIYAREWFPVFLSRTDTPWQNVHVFDFFAGPGQDVAGVDGSPVRVVREALECRHQLASGKLNLHFHFSDADSEKTTRLESHIRPLVDQLPHSTLSVSPLPFAEAFNKASEILEDPNSAKLVIIDPCGVNHVDDSIFQQLVTFPTTDFILFVPSSYLHRFKAHPALKIKLKNSDSFYRCHRAVIELYRSFVPEGLRYYLAPFSIKKQGAQIYGLIFGSSHPLGMDKFLTAAWSKDKLNGEANFDINQEDFQEHAPFLALDMFEKPTKLRAFEGDLKEKLLSGLLHNELEVVDLCFKHGVRRQHAEQILKKLSSEGQIEMEFRIPQFTHKPPRPIKIL